MKETGKNRLDFEVIREQLMECANSSLGKKKIEKLTPSDRYDVVVHRQRLTTEAKAILAVQGSAPLHGISGIDQDLDRAKKEYILQPKELIAIADFLRGCRSMKKFMVEQSHLAPELSSYAMNLEVMKELEDEILETVEPQGVHPRATKELWRLNRAKESVETNIKMRLDSFFEAAGDGEASAGAVCQPQKRTFCGACEGHEQVKISGQRCRSKCDGFDFVYGTDGNGQADRGTLYH